MIIFLLIISLPLVYFYFTALKNINYRLAISLVYKDKMKIVLNLLYFIFIYLLAMLTLYSILTYNTLYVIILLIVIMISYSIVIISQK